MADLRKTAERLFFYSSRQLRRRWKSYLSIFLTSAVLLALVMTFLEMMESWFLRDIRSSESGYHHVLIREMMNDHAAEIASHPDIEQAWSIPYTSLMASSDDASIPGRVVVPTEDILDRLDVQYVWGRAPEDGEIAVSAELYNAYGYLTAGEENELYFKASQMTYFPLTVSGIFKTNDREAGYVFVTRSTADAIDAETGAVEKFDTYFRCTYASDRSIPIVLDAVYRDLRIPDTRWQKPYPLPESPHLDRYEKLTVRYKEYINTPYLEFLESQNALPVMAVSMPVIVIAALMMASFMSGWITSHAEEYGILGAIGANRRQICAISAGQILLLGLAAAVPVVLISAGISNIYISAYNAASGTDVDYVFAVPWLRLAEAALWWSVLACFFSYIGIARITREMPYVLLSGQSKFRIPYVARSSRKLAGARHKILALSLVKARRTIRSQLVTAVITSLICVVCGAFLMLLILFRAQTAELLTNYNRYLSDMTVTRQQGLSVYDRDIRLTSELLDKLLAEPLVEKAGLFDITDAGGEEEIAERRALKAGESKTLHYPYRKMDDGDYRPQTVYTMDAVILEAACGSVLAGDPAQILNDPEAVVALVSPYAENMPQVGDKIALTGTVEYTRTENDTRKKFGDTAEYTVCAVVVPMQESSDLKLQTFSWILSDAGRQRCGLTGNRWTKILTWFTDDAAPEDLRTMYERLVYSPVFMRYQLTAAQVQTKSEERIQAATTAMLCFFFGMLYLSFCTMTYTDAFLKISHERRDIAILRQIGADDRAVHKTIRGETWPGILLALSLSLALLLLVPTVYILTQTAYVRAMGDYYEATAAMIAEDVARIIKQGTFMYLLFLPSIPMHLFSAGVTLLGTYLPTRRILKEPIAEAIRKDTDG